MRTKVYKYKTLKGLINQSQNQIVTLDNILEGTILLRGRGWCKFELSFDEKERFAQMCAQTLGGRKDTKQRIARIITYNSVTQTFGIYRRLWAQKNTYRKGQIDTTYCAGQDYISERALIRKLLLTK